MEKKQYTLAGAVFLAAFVAFLGWFFLASYIGHRQSPQVKEQTLTVHDDLLAIDGRHNGNKVAIGKFGLILLTQDGGKTWQRRPSGTARTLSAVSFADYEHGFVVGNGGIVLVTEDGGITWRPQNSGTKDPLLGVYALSPTQAFVVGAFGTMLSTTDGGRNWRKHDLKWDTLIERIVKEGGYVEPNLNAVYFSSSEIGWVVGEFGLVLNTKDGGQTWTSQRYGSDLPQLYAIKFLDALRGWTLGQAGTFIATRDGGQRWASVELKTSRDLYDVALDSERGVIVGDGVIFVSHDGGFNWKPMDVKARDQWLSGVALKSSEAIAVGQGGTTQLLALDNVEGRKAP